MNQETPGFSGDRTGAGQLRPHVDNNLVWAILCTVMCCLPTGIVGIVYASRVDRLVAEGRVEEARSAARTSLIWSISGAVLTVVGLLFYFIFVIILAIASNA